MNKQVQKGFTLIELMIVIAIVGILAAIALPAYQDYIVRSKMSEPLAALAEAKTSISEFYATNNYMPEDSDKAGLLTNPAKDIVVSIGYSSTISANLPLVTAVIADGVIPGGNDPYGFSLSGVTRGGSTLAWKCKSVQDAPYSQGTVNSIPTKFLPSNCR
ncbi:prepilin-type N-terminal cleavage/methylation domain-containing protein [Mangrovimicrobium sediminis]|uniref:Prepilin-type N-terminal cleavage/methylation domain-containing protein n=1 Tax=Mangrovimicrobium sediminis TaxID=2562682 RepID=A0A4Z0M3H1_9GAMM|nr:pilin [Haliea sp. SAOS-164]TGD74051.1 prepilin-type N-terminal cleavage/methylation domain-containing protein [Haliea sp. SAOS-164]